MQTDPVAMPGTSTDVKAPGDGAEPPRITGVKRERAPRQQKTTEQWMALEAAYLMDNYPSDEQYRKLATNLVLSTLQVREWFCKRRKKSKDGTEGGFENRLNGNNANAGSPGGAAGGAGGGAGGSGGSGGPPSRRRRRTSGNLIDGEDSNVSDRALRIIARAKEVLVTKVAEGASGPLKWREDGPALGLYFDPVPKSRGGGGARKRTSDRQSQRQELSRLLSRVREEERARKREEVELRKREQEAIRRQKAAEKEAERAMRMQLKLEMLERKELERQQRAQEKLDREREMQEMRRLREEEKAKARIERQMQREEAMRKREEEKQERKRLREFERMKAAEERAAAKLMQEQLKQLVEDEELERDELVAAEKKKRQEEAAGADANGDDGAAEMAVEVDREALVLPKFPPEEVETLQIFDTSSVAKSLGVAAQLSPQTEQDLVMVWKFIRDYSFVLNVKPLTLGDLAGSIVLGVESKQLADLHMALLKLLLADIEESHSLVNQEDGMEHKGGQISGLDRVVHNFSKNLNEIWEWHFGSDLLRAQRNYLTWPEVLRQFLVIFGFGPERPKIRKNKKAAAEVREASATGPALKPPATCRPGTIKGAAWTVLAEAGVEGMTAAEITEKMNDLGLKTMSQGPKTPEASVNGALSRDSFVFEKVGKHKYALRVICSWHRRQKAADEKSGDKGEGETKEAKPKTPVKKEAGEAGAAKMEVDGEEEGGEEGKEGVKKEEEESPKKEAGADGDGDDDDEDGDTKPRRLGETFVRKLAITEYNKLSVQDRTSCLAALCSAVLECPSLYQELEAAMREKDSLMKRLREVQRDEKKLRIALTTSSSAAAAAAAANGSDGAADQQAQKAEDEELKQAQKAELADLVVEKEEILARVQIVTDEINRMPLGLDRRFNRYWHLKLSQEKGDAFLLIEDASDHSLRIVKDKASLDTLMSKLNPRGFRESKLIKALEKKAQDILPCLPAQSCKVTPPEASMDFMTGFKTEAWAICSKEYRKPPSSEVDYAEHPKTFLVEKLKADLLDVHYTLPSDAFDDEAWDGPSVWIAKVKSATKVYDLRDILGELEGAIKDKYLDADHFNRSPRVVPGAWVPRDADFDDDDEDQGASQSQGADDDDDEEEGYIANEGDVSWLPPTTSALQYRLRCLDAACTFRRSTKPMCVRIDAYKYIQRDNPRNKDGTNFTVIAANGQAKVTTTYTRERNRSAFPAFPEASLVNAGDFMLNYQDFQKQFRKIGFDFAQVAKHKATEAEEEEEEIVEEPEESSASEDQSDDEFYVKGT